MAQLSEHFWRDEFRCKGCPPARPCQRGGVDTVDAELLAILERVRVHFQAATTINSGHRCPEYNAAIKGALSSQHLLGRAADISVAGVTPAAVYAFLDPDHPGGLGLYATFVHVDTRRPRARWSDL